MTESRGRNRLSPNDPVWTVQEAKAKLSEVLRRAREEGPQVIGTTKRCVLVDEAQWRETVAPRKPLGQWLIENTPRGGDLELPERAEPSRPTPFADEP